MSGDKIFGTMCGSLANLPLLSAFSSTNEHHPCTKESFRNLQPRLGSSRTLVVPVKLTTMILSGGCCKAVESILNETTQ